MYQTHFRFNQKPFEAAPDTNFLFLNNTYREILSALVYGVSERKGVVALIGDVGTGKTLMLKALMERLDGGTRAAFLVHTNLPFIQMLMIALNEFG
jgi:general secretion pathway protein A